MPTLHPGLHVQFEYQLEGEYLAITKDRQYAALPTARDIRICETTERYLYPMNQALYPVKKNRMVRICTLQTRYRKDKDLLHYSHYI